MAAVTTLEQEHPRLAEARMLLEQRGILAGDQEYTTRTLARELIRRGWRWELEANKAKATKAYAPSGTVSQTFVAYGRDQLATLTIVLADAIRFDDEHGLSTMSPYRADLIVRAPDDRIVALVEIKNLEELTVLTATNIRRDLIAHGRLDNQVPYFLMVSQDVGFLWDRSTGALPFSQPTVQFPMGPIVTYYLPWLGKDERLSGRALELAVAQWLTDLADQRPERPREADQLLEPTQFMEAIQGASVSTDAPL